MSVTEAEVAADRPFVVALRTGNLMAIEEKLRTDSAAANARLAVRDSRTHSPLHVVADWPGYYPNAPKVVEALIAAGADPDGGVGETRTETPLHWAASTDDVDVATALLDGGANIEAPGSSIAGGSPLDNAVGYGCWSVAHLLFARGALVTRLWHAAALGLQDRLTDLLEAASPPSSDEINEAFWQACHGGQRRTAEQLLAHGADVNVRPEYAEQSAVDIAASPGTGRDLLQQWLRAAAQRPTSP